MSLTKVAALVQRAATLDYVERQLRARFYNLIESFTLGHVSKPSIAARLVHMQGVFLADRASSRADTCLSALLRAWSATDLRFKERDHYARPECLAAHQREYAVTFQRNQFGRLGTYLLGTKSSGFEIRTAFHSNGPARGRTFVGSLGAVDSPLWLTPYVGQVSELCEEALTDGLGPVRRAEIVRTIVSTLGLIGVDVGDELVAFVTRGKIGDLFFNHPLDPDSELLPVGPTPIEARGHRRFRNWPQPHVEAFGYGRTYALDENERAGSADKISHGLPEAVRPRMQIDEFSDCIVIGTLNERPPGDSDAAYLAGIGAIDPLPEVILKVARQFGV